VDPLFCIVTRLKKFGKVFTAFNRNFGTDFGQEGLLSGEILKLRLGGLHVNHGEQHGIWIQTQHH
jgi:hypothetical protein